MNIVFTIIAAFPMGFLIRQRGLAIVAFLAADAFMFTFQTVSVLLSWMSGEAGIGGAKAFGPFPTTFPITFDEAEVYAYGGVNLAILLVGIGLVVLGNKIAIRRAAKRAVVAVG